MAQEKYDVFISYSRKDTAIADQICKALEHQGISYFIDRQGIGGGQEFPEILAEAIIGCRIMLYLASENCYVSKFTSNEITFAFNEKPKGSILPYIIDGSRLPATQRFIFASVNIRTLREHPVDTILMQDLCQLLGRSYKAPSKATTNNTKAEEDSLNMTAEEMTKRAYGFYKSKNYAEAAKWYLKAAEQGFAQAQCSLGYMYAHGEGVKEDKVEAIKWYRKAAEQGEDTAQWRLGNMYDSGSGVRQDKTEAAKWYRKSAEQGNLCGQFFLGLLYELGEGVREDITQAFYWYRKSAEQGYDIAQWRLGNMYENGEGVKQDYTEAVKWYRKAAEQGNEDAKKELVKLGYST